MTFVKGDPRINRAGQPYGTRHSRIREIAAKILDEPVKLKNGKVPRLEAILRRVADKARAGDLKAAEFSLTWAYGRPPANEPDQDRRLIESEIITRFLATLPTEALVVIKKLTEQEKTPIDITENSEIIQQPKALTSEPRRTDDEC